MEQDEPLPWNTYIDALTTVTIEQIENIKSNIIDNYNLDEIQIESIQNLFNNSVEYKVIIHNNLKKIILAQKFNNTKKFMLAFTITSNKVVEKILKYNLDKVTSAFLSPTLWYRQTLKDKILRQETKIVTNRVDSYICRATNICKEKLNYTDYLKEWLRHLLSAPDALKEMFVAVPSVLEKHKQSIKSNVKFRQTIKYILNSDAVVQKDTLDFVDEVIANKERVVDLVPAALKKSARLLKKLFAHINKSFDVKHCSSNLASITNMIYDWALGENIKMEVILDEIVENMIQTLKKWPLDVQSEVKSVWSKIIVL